jgi:NAD(P)-dependent dehydrogenase (short-subunit alcohol dehydrogenase family)
VTRDLRGAVVAVTGASAGIGREGVLAFAREGARLAAAARRLDRLEALATEVRALGAEVLVLKTDVGEAEDVKRFVQATVERFGRLDVLVNNAGLNVRGDFRHLSDADWVKIREVNLDGVVRVARDGFALLKASGRGSLINIASIMGHRGLRQLTAYSATKGAVLALTRGLAVEYAPFDIRVNALAPGFVETALTARALKNLGIQKALIDSTPMRRFGLPEEIAKAALFFASDDASYVTGAALAVDGGMSAGL